MEHLLSIDAVPPYTVVTIQTSSLMNPSELEWIGGALVKALDEGARAVLLDLGKVEYLSSQGIGVLVQLKRKVDSKPNGSLVICGVQPRILQLLKLTRLDKMFNIKPTRKDAFGPGMR